MIQLDSTVKPADEILLKLQEYQDSINGKGTFEKRAEAAKKDFSARNKTSNAAFQAVKKSLTAMCSGARRCCYCEDSVGDEVEHIYPKSLYPEFCFNWDNYLYACGNCNGPKNDKFAVFKHDSGFFTEVNPPKGQAAQQPPAGKPVLINPRLEDAMEFCMLDLTGTFEFILRTPQGELQPGTEAYQRAHYTINTVLRLNEREFLREAREHSYGDFKARLGEYVRAKANNAVETKLNKMIAQLRKHQHPTVWKEAQRYHKLRLLGKFDQEFDEYFLAAPEALTW